MRNRRLLILALLTLSTSSAAWATGLEHELAAVSETEWLALDGDLLRERLRVAERCPELEAAAGSGNTRAITLLAGTVNAGLCGPADPDRAMELADRAAYRGDLRGQLLQAQLVGAGGNPAGGEALLQASEMDRVPLALYLRGINAYHGIGRSVDRDYALRNWRAAANAGNYAAMSALGSTYLAAPTRDLDEANRLMLRAAQSGLAEAMARYGINLVEGWFGEGREAEAIPWLERAVAKGNIPATTQLGWALAWGRGGQRDPVRGVQLLNRAADAGSPVAMRALGDLYDAGTQGVPPDRARAITYLERASAQRDGPASRRLYTLYSAPEATAEERRLAMSRLLRAVELGDANAINDAGVEYERGTLVQRNLELARDHYLRANDAGVVAAKYNLGRMYDYGILVPRDPLVARGYYTRARDAGSEPARRALLDFDARQQQFDEAQRNRVASRGSPPNGASASAGLRGAPNAYDIRAALMREWSIAVLGMTARDDFDAGVSENGVFGTGIRISYVVTDPSCRSLGGGRYNCSYRLQVRNSALLFGAELGMDPNRWVQTTNIFAVEGSVWRSPSAREVARAHAARIAATPSSSGASDDQQQAQRRAFYCPGNGANPLDTRAFC